MEVVAQIPVKVHIVKDHNMKERLCLKVERLGLSAVIMGSRGFPNDKDGSSNDSGDVTPEEKTEGDLLCSLVHKDELDRNVVSMIPEMEARRRSFQSHFSISVSLSRPREGLREENGGQTAITLQEWQGWGTDSPLPERVSDIVHELKALEKEFKFQTSFGGPARKLEITRFKKIKSTEQHIRL